MDGGEGQFFESNYSFRWRIDDEKKGFPSFNRVFLRVLAFFGLNIIENSTSYGGEIFRHALVFQVSSTSMWFPWFVICGSFVYGLID